MSSYTYKFQDQRPQVQVSHAQQSPHIAVSGLWGPEAVGELVGVLGRVADPRAARGKRHSVGSVLAVVVFAVLAGAGNYRQAGDRAAGVYHDKGGSQ